MERQEDNDLFYTCSLIEYIARITENKKSVIVSKLGRENIEKIYRLASVYHVENIDKVASDFIEECGIEKGNYCIQIDVGNSIPSYYDIGKVYKRLIIMIDNRPEYYVDNLIKVLSSWIILEIDNYNSSMYYENPSYIYACYKEGKIL